MTSRAQTFRTAIVLPSYNEAQNIVAMVRAVLEAVPDAFVVVVDDTSPDGTGDLLRAALGDGRVDPERVELRTRAVKSGRGGAVRDGLAWALRELPEVRVLVEMDCDFSHEPRALATGIALLGEHFDVVIGARYPSGTIIGWPLRRRVFSFCANAIARGMLDARIADYTNGFRFYTAAAARVLADNPQRHRGYIYLSESMSLLLRHGFRIGSFPIVFRDRGKGASNVTAREIALSLTGLFAIAMQHHRGRV
jgi:glycosyltransferase involved in cell wall biosynthesis